MADQTRVRKYFFLTLLGISGIFTILLLWPFARVIILAVALTVVLTPVYKWWLKRVRGISWLASLITVLCFIIVLGVPFFILSSIVFSQSQALYSWIVDHGGVNHIIDGLNRVVGRYIPFDSVDIASSIQSAFGSVSASVGSIFSATLSTLLSFFLVLLSMFYFFKDGKKWKETLFKLSPLTDTSHHYIVNKLSDATSGIIKGYLLIGVVQGLLMGIGLTVFGVSNAALWGVVAGIASFIPTIGTALVSIPAIVFLLSTGHTGAGVGMAIWAGVLVGSVDNILSPYFVGHKIAIHPLLVLFAVLGGLAFVGPIGILVGPLIISFLYALISVYKSEVVV